MFHKNNPGKPQTVKFENKPVKPQTAKFESRDGGTHGAESRDDGTHNDKWLEAIASCSWLGQYGQARIDVLYQIPSEWISNKRIDTLGKDLKATVLTLTNRGETLYVIVRVGQEQYTSSKTFSGCPVHQVTVDTINEYNASALTAALEGYLTELV